MTASKGGIPAEPKEASSTQTRRESSVEDDSSCRASRLLERNGVAPSELRDAQIVVALFFDEESSESSHITCHHY